MKYVIIGGVAGGATTAARLRRLDEKATIIMFEKGAHISYANCGMPYYIGDVITKRETLFLQTPNSFGNRFDVDVRVDSEVVSIDTSAKTVTVFCHKNQKSYTETYDKLVLATGAEPIIPPIKNADLNGIFTLRNITDMDRIKQFANAILAEKSTEKRRATIVGAGFIGLEMAENLHKLGFHITIIEKEPQILPTTDFPIAATIQQHLKNQGVTLLLNNGVESFEAKNSKIVMSLQSGEKVESDLVLLSVGVKADTKLAKTANLKIGDAGGIVVDEFFQTSEKNIYAIGDVIEYQHLISGKSYCNYLAGQANKQARLLADHFAGSQKPYRGSVGTAIAKIFNMTIAAAGLSEKKLRQLSMPFQTSITHTASHASYYPDSQQVTIKLNYHPTTGQLYGGQVVGAEGVDKRTDLIAAVLSQKGTIWDLMDIEHAYAPPFSSAKDPVTIAACVAENIITGKMFPMQYADLQAVMNEPDWQSRYFLIDVRTVAEFRGGSIDGAVNMPVDELRELMDEIPTDKKIIIFCAIGLRGHVASRILLQSGFSEVFNVVGGFKTYKICTEKIN